MAGTVIGAGEHLGERLSAQRQAEVQRRLDQGWANETALTGKRTTLPSRSDCRGAILTLATDSESSGELLRGEHVQRRWTSADVRVVGVSRVVGYGSSAPAGNPSNGVGCDRVAA